MEVIPAIIPEDFEDLTEKLNAVKGLAPLVQVDVIDGEFAPEASWPFADAQGKEDFQKLASGEEGLPLWREFDYEVDLMIANPEKNIQDWVQAGFARIIIHLESTNSLNQILDDLEDRVEIGVAIEIDTPVSELEPFLLKIDFVQFMGIAEIGSQGQGFDERVIPKIKDFKARNPGVTISVDGGVNLINARALQEAGVDRLVSGSTVFGSSDISQTIQELKNPS